MDLAKISFFEQAKRKLSWLTQRQEVLAQNVANADTPKYRAHDLKAFRFQELVRREKAQINMDLTSASHLGGQRKRIRDFADEETRRPFETAPGGNAVVLEEQMGKINETQVTHNMTAKLYRKHLNLLQIALGKR